MVHKVKGEQLTIYHAHADRYLRDAGGNKRRALAEIRKDREGNASMAAFYDAVVRIIEARSE